MPKHFFHEFHLNYRESRKSFAFDFSRLSYCECGEFYLQFLKEHYGDALDEATVQSLHAAIAAITADYRERVETLPSHPFNACVPDVYAEVISLLTQKRRELERKPMTATAAHLYLGKEAEMPAD